MRKVTLLALLALTVSLAGALPNSAARATCDRVVVTGDDIAEQAEDTPPTKNWVLYKRNAGDGEVRVGPATPPSGVGSYEITTPTGADKATLFNFDHVGVNLSDINKIGYSTYRSAGSLQQVAALNIQVDINGADPGGFTTLVFEPVYNTGQGPVISNQWQTWDAFQGGSAVWWSSNPINVAPNRDTFVSWSTIVAANPNAVIIGGFGVNEGSGNPGLTTATDNLSLGYGTGDGAVCVTYDFEPYRVATSKDDCKDGGWQKVKTAGGAGFKNQGQCVQYVNTGK
ncbi:MAG TPA: hypothetical protein VJ866_19805 [Pyrinomonadaceae bacterium]|nr:hypothetical protein [Pyrinomonadaceae bacterium]